MQDYRNVIEEVMVALDEPCTASQPRRAVRAAAGLLSACRDCVPKLREPPLAIRRLQAVSCISSPLVVNAVDATYLMLLSPVFVVTPPAAALERLVVCLPRDSTPFCASHVARIQAQHVDVCGPGSEFVVALIAGIHAAADENGNTHVHVYGSAFTRSAVEAHLFQEAVNGRVTVGEGTWSYGPRLRVTLESRRFRPPLWAL